MKLRKLTALFLAAVTAASLSVSASAGYVKEGTTTLIDTRQSIEGEVAFKTIGEQTYLVDEKGNIIRGKSVVYLNLSHKDSLGFDMRMCLFDKQTGISKGYYTGFTKSTEGKRYYKDGERITGWYKIGSSWYHFNKKGYANTGRVKIAGAIYTFDTDGKWTGKVSEEGVVPANFTLRFSGSLGDYGFSTNGDLSHGRRGKDILEVGITLSQRDKGAIYAMFRESAMESYNGKVINNDYLKNTLKSDYFDNEQKNLVIDSMVGPSDTLSVTVTLGGKTMSVGYTEDGDQLIHFDKAAYAIHKLTRNLKNYYKIMAEKYPAV